MAQTRDTARYVQPKSRARRSHNPRSLQLFAASALALCVFAPDARADIGVAENAVAQAEMQKTDAQTPLNQSFEVMRSDLASPEKAFAFVQEAIRANELREAISTLERILQINPNLDNIKLELGVLYARTGRPELGRVFIEQALTNPEIPTAARARARATLGDVKRQASPHRFSGSLFAGAQYDTNPNAAPDEVQLSIPGFSRPLTFAGSQLSERDEDQFSFVISGAGEYAYRLNSLSGVELVADGSVFANAYQDRSDLNVIAGAVRFGPRFQLSGATQFRPYVALGALNLDGRDYYRSGALGFTLNHRLTSQAYGQLFAQFEQRDYKSSATRQRAGDETGDYLTYGVAVGFNPRSHVQLRGDLYGESVSADGKPSLTINGALYPAAPDYQDRMRYGARARISYLQRPLIGPQIGLWEFGVFAGYRRTEYEAPDPLISATVEREEDQIQVGADFSAPVRERLSLDLSLQYVSNKSNLSNFEYDNSSVTMGLTYRF